MKIQANNENKTTFNLIMPNGLPYKPIIRCETTIFTQKKNENAGIVHLELPDPSPIDDELNIVLKSHNGIVMDEEEVFVDIGDFYIVGDCYGEFIWKSAQEKTLQITIYKNHEFIAGYKLK